MSDRILTTGLAILVLVASVLATDYFADAAPIVFLTLPVAIALLVAVWASFAAEANALGGYVAELEAEYNRRIGHPVAIWESSLARARGREANSTLLLIAVGFAMTLAFSIGLWQAFQFESPTPGTDDGAPHRPWLLPTIATTFVSVVIILLCFAYTTGTVARYRARAAALLNPARTGAGLP